MSYLVLARKWRPQRFEDLVGQEHITRTLGNAIAGGRVHHAFLFTGARGVGKTSAARILAKALNCEEGLSAQPCDRCSSCLEITSGQGVDVFEIDGASNTGVDDVRELRENIRYLPSRSRFKIFIIDEVHMLSINAFNALLKTLEEPPEHAKFILATTEPHKIPVTILSRCQRLDFRKIPRTKLVARLQEIAVAEKIEISESALALVARRGEGSMRDSLSTLDQVIAFCGDTVSDGEVQGLLGMIDRRLLLDALEGILARDSRRALEAVRRVDHLGYSFRQFCRELVEGMRALVLLRVAEDPAELLDLAEEELAELRGVIGETSLEDLQRALTLLLKTEGELAHASFPRLVVEMALVRLTQLPPARDVAALVRKLEDLERHMASGTSCPGPAEVAPPPQVPPPESSEPPPKKVEAPAPTASGVKGWPGLVEFAKSRRPRIGSILEHGSPLNGAPPQLELGYPEGSFHLESLRDADTMAALEALAGEYFAEPVTVKLVSLAAEQGKSPPSLAHARRAERTDRNRKLREEALATPAVKTALEILGGEVVEIKAIDKLRDENPG